MLPIDQWQIDKAEEVLLIFHELAVRRQEKYAA